MTLNPVGAINWPTPDAAAEWPEQYRTGSTEPWTSQVVASLLAASMRQTVLELGCYHGHTSVWLCQTLQRMGGGEYLGVDIEAERQAATMLRLSKLALPNVRVKVVQADALSVLHSLAPRSIGFAWVDDDHTPEHVAAELELLYDPTQPEVSRMAPGGIICMHDVCGGEDRMTPLRGVCQAAHGYTLEWPRIGLLGGLGIIQVPVR